jgi:CRP-like cAMP-binding protein
MMRKEKNQKIESEEVELVKFLSEVSLFSKLTKSERKNLVKYIYVRKYSSKEIVFKQNYPNVVFYILKQGELTVTLDKDDSTIELNRLQPGEFFGEIGLFLDDNRTATVTAITDSVLLAISKKDLADFIARFPRAGVKLLYNFGELLSRNVIELNKKLEICTV